MILKRLKQNYLHYVLFKKRFTNISILLLFLVNYSHKDF